MTVYGVYIPPAPGDATKRARLSWEHIRVLRKIGYAVVLDGDGDTRVGRQSADIVIQEEA